MQIFLILYFLVGLMLMLFALAFIYKAEYNYPWFRIIFISSFWLLFWPFCMAIEMGSSLGEISKELNEGE